MTLLTVQVTVLTPVKFGTQGRNMTSYKTVKVKTGFEYGLFSYSN